MIRPLCCFPITLLLTGTMLSAQDAVRVTGLGTFRDGIVIGGDSIGSYPDTVCYFDPVTGAFRAGLISNGMWLPDAVGARSFAVGQNTDASGLASTALGRGTVASGSYSTALGYLSVASGLSSLALGYENTASASYSYALGYENVASGSWSVALGFDNVASAFYSKAMGNVSEASGIGSTALNFYTHASGDYSVACGYESEAAGYASNTLGLRTISHGYGGLAVGIYNDPILTNPETDYSDETPLFIVGNGTSSLARSNAFVIRHDGLVHATTQFQIGTGGTKFKNVQTGSSNIGSNPAGGVKTVTVTYPTSFSSTPKVVCVVRGEDFVDTFVVSTRAVTSTNFKVNVYRVDNGGGNWGQNLYLDWIASN